MNLHLASILPRYLESNGDSEVWDRDIAIESGQNAYVYSVSGKGKSSLINILYGNHRDFSGRIAYDGRDVATFTQKEWSDIRRDRISIVFQDLKLFENLSALDNIRIKADLTGSDIGDALEMADTLGIRERMDRPCGSLSLGERQRLAIIRAMCQPFSLLLLDEPLSHLDEANGDTAFQLIRQQCEERRAGFIMTGLLRLDEECFDHVLAL